MRAGTQPLPNKHLRVLFYLVVCSFSSLGIHVEQEGGNMGEPEAEHTQWLPTVNHWVSRPCVRTAVDRDVHHLGCREVTIFNFLSLQSSEILSNDFLTSLLKAKEAHSFQTEVVNRRPPLGTRGRHSNRVQHNLLSCA